MNFSDQIDNFDTSISMNPIIDKPSARDSPLLVNSTFSENVKWRLTSKTKISSSISRYEFSYPNLLIRSRVNRIGHFGKHFKVYLFKIL